MLIHLLFVLSIKIVLGDTFLRINNASEFVTFSNNVNKGNSYSGTTVYLDFDLSLSGEPIEPIGRSKYFLGVFDGQGHTISDLKISSSSVYTGLFRYSEGMTIRNVVLDSSCFVTCNFTGNTNSIRVGGLIGECYSTNGECNIENSVNMADITFSGNTTGSSGLLYLGGIAGHLSSSSNYLFYVKNCVNYGTVTHSGKVSSSSDIGGIVGRLYGSSSSSYIHVYNCLNYGTITHNGTSGSLPLGGIAGYSRYAYIENCMNAGEISITGTLSESNIGGIVGYVYSGSSITHCYYTSGVVIGKVYDDSSSTPTITETPTSPSDINLTLIDNLNNYASKNDTWNKWLLNTNNASVSFIINYGKGFTVNSQIILFPSLANSSEGNFSGWYSDADLNSLFNSSQVDSNTTLYRMSCEPSNYTVTLDVNGGNNLGENEMNVGCMDYYVLLPENVIKEGYIFVGWFTKMEGGYKVESGDKIETLDNHTLYAHWVINNYTVTFDFDNGTAVDKIFVYNTSIENLNNESMEKEGYIFNGWNETVTNMPAQNITITALWIANNYTVTFDVNEGNDLSDTSKNVTFNSQYGPLPTPTKEGHMFVGWFTEKANGTKVTNDTIVSIADNHTLHALWEKVTNYVEIVFNTKDLSREEVKKIVKKYTDAKFEITKYENGDNLDGVWVIIKFTNNEDAKNFVETIKGSSEMNDIKKIDFISGYDASFSLMLYPILFFNIIFFII